jgi:hypothetical protein
MEIRFISSLTDEDENLFAPALLKAVVTLLDQLPIAYTMRIETTGSQVFQHTHPSARGEVVIDSVAQRSSRASAAPLVNVARSL